MDDMTQKPPNILYGYFPLWGAKFDSQEVGLLGGAVNAMIPYKDEWRLLQKSDAWVERFAHVLETFSDDEAPEVGPEPPPCLVIVLPLVADENFTEGVERLKDQMIEEARDAVLALRLFKPGWFIDPEMAECAFVQKPNIARLPGPFRQAFMESVPEELPARYSLRMEDLSARNAVPSPQKGPASPVAGLWNLMEQYKHIAHHTTADIAIENFNRSYGFKLRGTQRAAFLFAVIDTLLGGMDATRIGRLKLHSHFRERVYAALDAVQGTWLGTDSTPLELTQWLNTAGRRMHVAITKGEASTVDVEANGSWEYIQLIVRVILRQYIEFSVKWFKNPAAVCGRLGLPDQVAPVIGYNLALELKVKNGAKVDDLLRFDLSRIP